MSKAYVLANVKVNDPDGYTSSYQDHVSALVQNYHGTFLVRGGNKTDMETSFPYDRFIVIEFHHANTLKIGITIHAISNS